jgi:hypothetical protein
VLSVALGSHWTEEKHPVVAAAVMEGSLNVKTLKLVRPGAWWAA